MPNVIAIAVPVSFCEIDQTAFSAPPSMTWLPRFVDRIVLFQLGFIRH